MPHRIFLSHKFEDKPIVEPVALRLREIFGEAEVFYDAWSIQPGDGIIEQMDKGLSAPEFVFFFVSKLSLESGLVKLEWQNALLKASKGQTRLIPVRIDAVPMPEVLRQSLYIDMYSVGIEVGINQIVNVVQGNSSFTPQHIGFANLTRKHLLEADGTMVVVISASHLMEPNPDFVFLLDHDEADLSVLVRPAGMMKSGFHRAPFGPGKGNAWAVAPIGGAITPERPLTFTLKANVTGTPIKLLEVLHGWSEPFRVVPLKN